MAVRQIQNYKEASLENVHLTSFTGDNLIFLTVFGLAATWFLAETSSEVCFDSCKSKKYWENSNYSLRQLLTFSHIMDFAFSKYLPLLQKNLKTYDTSFESLKIEHLESRKKLCLASLWGWPRALDWKSTTSTKTRLEPFIAKILSISKLLSNNG